MTSPEWEAANEDDSDRFPQPSPHEAPSSSVDPLRSDSARVARYAEAIQRAIEDEPAHMTETGPLVVSGLPRCYAFPMSEKAALAVVPVADEERAPLVAEVERLRGQLLKAAPALTRIAMLRQERDAARAENAKQSKIRSRLTTLDATNLKSEIRRADAAEEMVREMGREAATEAEAYRAVLARAEAAEAKVAKVEALADAVRALRNRVHASKERGAAYDAWVLTDLLDSALEGHTCADPNAECWACAVLAEGTLASPTSQTTGGGCSDAPAEQREHECDMTEDGKHADGGIDPDWNEQICAACNDDYEPAEGDDRG